jgi:hypothetical protein
VHASGAALAARSATPRSRAGTHSGPAAALRCCARNQPLPPWFPTCFVRARPGSSPRCGTHQKSPILHQAQSIDDLLFASGPCFIAGPVDAPLSPGRDSPPASPLFVWAGPPCLPRAAASQMTSETLPPRGARWHPRPLLTPCARAVAGCGLLGQGGRRPASLDWLETEGCRPRAEVRLRTLRLISPAAGCLALLSLAVSSLFPRRRLPLRATTDGRALLSANPPSV